MAKRRPLPPHIQKRRKRYYAVLEIPEDLRLHFPGKQPGKSLVRLVRSLETDSLSVAHRRVGPVVGAWRAEFARLKDEPDDASFYRRRFHKAKSDAERNQVLAEIEFAAAQITPTYTEFSQEHAEEVEEQAALEAEDFVKRATGKIVGFTDHVEAWLERSKVTDKTKAMQRSDVTRFAASFPTVQDVTHEAVQRWIDALGVSPKTVARILSALRGYWRYLQRHDVNAAPRDFQPFSNLDLPARGNGLRNKRKAFGPRDVVLLLMAAAAEGDRQLYNLIRMAMWTGCRIEELCSLKTKHVHDGYIEIEDAKTAAGWRQVPIHEALRETLMELVKKSKDGYVLSGLTENKYGDRSNAIGKRFGRLRTSRGFGPEFVFHSIRKTVATLLENAGVLENVSADILGHEKPRMTYGLYSGGTSLAVKAAAIAKLHYDNQAA